MKTLPSPVVFILTTITLLVGGATRQSLAEDAETIPVTFGLFIWENQLPDEDGDGIPEIPSFTSDDFAGIVFGTQEPTGTFSFASDSPPCDGYEVKDTSWANLGPGTAMIVGKGAPRVVTAYGKQDDFYPPAHRFLRIQNVAAVHACWIKENGSGQVFTQNAYDGYSMGVFVIVTGEFNIRDVL